MFIIYIYIVLFSSDLLINIGTWSFGFPDVPALVYPRTFELRTKKDKSPEVLDQEEYAYEGKRQGISTR